MTRLQRPDLDRAVSAGILSAEQADRLAEFFGAAPAAAPRFIFVHVLYYLGGMIAIGAMLGRRVFADICQRHYGSWLRRDNNAGNDGYLLDHTNWPEQAV